MSVYLNELGIVCALGHNKNTIINALLFKDEQEYLTTNKTLSLISTPIYVGQVNQLLPPLTEYPSYFHSHNNQLAYAAFLQIQSCYNEITQSIQAERIAVIIGTSTSGILEGEQASAYQLKYQHMPEHFEYKLQEMSAPADFIAYLSGAKGPVYSISTACSSSSKALISAKALIDSDIADIVICGGVDSLSQLPINGFQALESMAKQYCQPFSSTRDGINIGEGASLFIMSKQSANIALLGGAETSDAYHISAPAPNGYGAANAMKYVLSQAGILPEEVDYINAHGTATIKNDQMEAQAIFDIFKDKVPVSSTKRFTGHTLGAAGAIEAGICWLLLSPFNENNNIPINKGENELDPKLPKITLSRGQQLNKLTICLSNSFAFGGNNTSVLLRKYT